MFGAPAAGVIGLRPLILLAQKVTAARGLASLIATLIISYVTKVTPDVVGPMGLAFSAQHPPLGYLPTQRVVMQPGGPGGRGRRPRFPPGSLTANLDLWHRAP